MRKNLTPAETAALTKRVGEVESRTGIQLVAAVVGKSHAYPQLPWKAFALAASLAGFVVVVADGLRPDWVTASAVLLQVAAVLLAGAAAALLAVFVAPFARLFLRPPRREFEVRRYAQTMFLERELFATRGRNGVLLLVSLFEHQVEILPDRGFAPRVSAGDWRRVVEKMTPLLSEGRPADAVLAGLAAVEAMLVEKAFAPGAAGRNELPDRPIDTAGVRGADE
jgi:putative membrane protein